jgi:hypothetical protein
MTSLVATLTCLTLSACGLAEDSTIMEELEAAPIDGVAMEAERDRTLSTTELGKSQSLQDGLAAEGDELLSGSGNSADLLAVSESSYAPRILFTGYELGRGVFHPYEEVLQVCDDYPADYGVVVYYHTSSNTTGTWLAHDWGQGACKTLDLSIPESGWIQMHVCLLEPKGAFGCSATRKFAASDGRLL